MFLKLPILTSPEDIILNFNAPWGIKKMAKVKKPA